MLALLTALSLPHADNVLLLSCTPGQRYRSIAQTYVQADITPVEIR